MDELVGATLGRHYRVETRIGGGAFGTVYRALDLDDGSLVAIKAFNAGPKAAKVELRAQVERQLQSRLRHPNVVRIRHQVEHEGRLLLVMELIDGVNLATMLCDTGCLPYPTIDRLARGILDGVGAAHAHGIVHRDLKPENIMIAADGTPKIGDFGLARPMRRIAGSRDLTRAGAFMGTPGYVAPEQARDARNADARADVFSMGCILYELVTGERAYCGEELIEFYDATISGARLPLEAHRPFCPSRMRDAIRLALEPALHLRIPSARVLLDVWNGASWSPQQGVSGGSPEPDAPWDSEPTLIIGHPPLSESQLTPVPVPRLEIRS